MPGESHGTVDQTLAERNEALRARVIRARRRLPMTAPNDLVERLNGEIPDKFTSIDRLHMFAFRLVDMFNQNDAAEIVSMIAEAAARITELEREATSSEARERALREALGRAERKLAEAWIDAQGRSDNFTLAALEPIIAAIKGDAS